MITVQEFKSWIQGVEDMQTDNWHPNKVQWARIKEKISLLIEDPQPAYQQPFQSYNQPYQPPSIPTYRSTPDVDMSDIAYTNGDLPTFL